MIDRAVGRRDNKEIAEFLQKGCTPFTLPPKEVFDSPITMLTIGKSASIFILPTKLPRILKIDETTIFTR
jgi:hypothetical protein